MLALSSLLMNKDLSPIESFKTIYKFVKNNLSVPEACAEKKQEEEELDEDTKERIERVDFTIREFLTSEETYVEDLKEIYNTYGKYFIDPLTNSYYWPKEWSNPIILSGFLELQKLYVLNTWVLDNFRNVISLENSNLSNLQKFADVIINVWELFKLYSTYCSNYEEFSEEITNLKKSKRFESFFGDRQQELDLKNARMTDICSYLIIPVQRIPRYNLLMRDLIKKLDEEFIGKRAYHRLIKAREKMDEIANFLDKDAKIIKNFKTLEKKDWLREYFLPERNLLNHGLVLGRAKKSSGMNLKGFAVSGGSKNKKKSKFEIILFNDIFLVRKFSERKTGPKVFDLKDVQLEFQEVRSERKEDEQEFFFDRDFLTPRVKARLVLYSVKKKKMKIPKMLYVFYLEKRDFESWKGIKFFELCKPKEKKKFVKVRKYKRK